MKNKIKEKWTKLNKNQRQIIKKILIFQLFLFILGLIMSVLIYVEVF